MTEKELMAFAIERSNDPVIKNPVLRDAMNKDLGPRPMFGQGSSVDSAVRTMDPVQDSGNKIEEVLKAYELYRKNRPGKRPMKFKDFFEIYGKENFSEGGRTGYKDKGFVDVPRDFSSQGTPGVKFTPKEFKNIQDDLVNFDGLNLIKKGKSYYIRFRLQKGDNKISKQLTATPENIALVKKEQKAFMKTNYPNVLSNADFEQLRMLDENINLTVPEFTEVLNNKNKTTINGLKWNKATVQKLQGDLQLNDSIRPEFKGKKRKINVAKQIVRDNNPAELKRLNEISDIDIRNQAIRKKAADITGQVNQLQKTGTLQGITKNREGSLWKNFYESSKRNNRIKLGGTFNGKDLSFRKNWPQKEDGSINWFIKDTKTNKPAWQMLEFIDTQTPQGEVKFTYEGLQNQVDEAFGKGHFARSTNAYSSGRELYGKNIMFEGKMQPIGRVITKQTIINNYKANNNGKVPTEKYVQDRIRINTPTQVHHTKGIGNDPYTVQLVSRDANQKLNAAELTYKAEISKAKGDPTKIKNLNSEFKKTINQLSNEYGGIKYDVDGKTVGKAATGESSYTSAIKESGISQKMQNKLIEQIASKNPKVAEKVAIQFNSGIPVDQIMKELSRVPGMNKLARGFMKVGGPWEVAFAGADFINNLDSMDPDEAFKTALSNVTFGAYGGDKREQMETLNDAAGELGYDNKGFNELKEVLDLQKVLEREKSLLTNMEDYNKTDKQGLQGNFNTFDLDSRKDFINRLEKEIQSKSTSLSEQENFKEMTEQYSQTVDYVARKQYNKNVDDRKNRVNPNMNKIGSPLWSAITEPIKTILPQNVMETTDVTRPYVRGLRKLPGIGQFFDPTSKEAKLSAMSEEDKTKRAEGLNAVRQNYHPVTGNSMNYEQMEESYDKYYSHGGIASLKRKI